MKGRHRRPAHELRVAIDCLPMETRSAMIDGVDEERIIVGAYTDRNGGACPMLAAHRRGGRTSFASFARAWDRYTRAGSTSRSASERELRTLRTMLEASMALEIRGRGALSDAIAEHEALQARTLREDVAARAERAAIEREAAEHEAAEAERVRRARPKRDTGERDRTKELAGKPGWSWLRPFRRLDEYEIAVAQLEELEREREGLEREQRDGDLAGV